MIINTMYCFSLEVEKHCSEWRGKNKPGLCEKKPKNPAFWAGQVTQQAGSYNATTLARSHIEPFFIPLFSESGFEVIAPWSEREDEHFLWRFLRIGHFISAFKQP